MASFHALQNYKQQAFNTMSRGELVTALYDGAIKNINLSVRFLKDGPQDAADQCMEKAQKIFSYLCDSLDSQYGVSQNLYRLYRFFYQEIIKAQIKKDSAPLEEILPLVEDLRNTWMQAEKLSHSQK